MKDLNTAIFMNCRYELRLMLPGKIKEISGIVAISDEFKTFDSNHSKINGLMGRISSLTNIEKVRI